MTPKEFVTHPTICTIPWTGFYLGPNGNIANCSISKRMLGNIKEESINNILNCSTNINIKTDLLNKSKTESCRSCWNVESLQKNTSLGISNRSHFKKALGKVIPLTIFNSPHNFSLTQVDLRWRNTCNLACVYCDSSLSSSWEKELGQIVSVNEPALEKTKNFIFDNITKLKYVYLCGGEPLLMKENIEFIKLLQEKNPDVFIRVNTNLTNIKSPIYQMLLECKNIHWIISVESIKDTFEYIRYGAIWEDWLNNLLKLKTDVSALKHKISFNMVWCSLTATGIFDAIDLLQQIGFDSNAFIIQILQDPEELKIQYLNNSTKEILKSKLETRIKSLVKNDWLTVGYQLMLEELKINYAGSNEILLKFINELDTRRNLNGLQLFAAFL